VTAEGDIRQQVIPPMFRQINRDLPPDARLLMINTNGAFHCDRDYLADSFFEASQIALRLGPSTDKDELRRRLLELEITHVLVRGTNGDAAQLLSDLLRDRNAATPLFRDRRDVLFELRRTR
jgi:hypothetical protein